MTLDLDPGLLRLALRASALEAEDRASRPHVEYQGRLLDWIVDKLGVPRNTLVWSENEGYDAHTWDGTPDPIAAMFRALDEWENAGVEAGTGTGKSFGAACYILAFLACWPNARVFTFAPKEDQLRLFIWKEIHELWPAFKALFPDAELTDLRIRMQPGGDAWGAWGYAVGVRAGEDVATKAAGMHAEHMLLVYEEGPGVPSPVYAAGENTCTGPHNLRLAIGNPDHQADPLHLFCLSPGVRHIRASSIDHPNVVTGKSIVPGGAVSRTSIDRRREKYGPDHPLYLSRVHGLSPKQAADALIRWEWLERAAARYRDEAKRAELARGPQAWGVDVANSEAGDRAAVARWKGATLPAFPSFACPDASKLGWRIALEAAASQPPVDPRHIAIDADGVGASTANKMKELNCYAQFLHTGKPAVIEIDPERQTPIVEEELFLNLRAQMWWQLAQDLFHDRVAVEYDEELFKDLTTPKWEQRKGVIVLESKETIRERLVGGRSPDKGDAAVYGNWVRQRWPEKREQPDPHPWDADVLRHEAEEGRKVHPAKVRQGGMWHPDMGAL